ncbi:AAA family ATPase [Parasutterella excrementihominis]|uniref:AAA family ATPase n=1 Tax=Parasutterella excrementihominis TaxID=487175 RepID=UPI0012BC56C4|nr:AAA family ATPase [Parasutterella excrementihominis]
MILRTTKKGSTETVTNEVASFRSLGRTLRILANEYGHALPVLLYYPANRFVSKGIDSGNIRADENNFSTFPSINWLIKQFKVISNPSSEGYASSTLIIEEVKKLLSKIFETFKNIRLDQSSGEDEIILDWRNDLRTKFKDLSLGQKSFMILFLDILMNIFLKSKENISNQRGVLLIDEIENHLHPSWQRKIFPTLKKSFSKHTDYCIYT